MALNVPGSGFYAPGGDANVWIQENWVPGIHAASYNKAKVIRLFEVMPKPGKKLHYPRHGNLQHLTLSDSTRGSLLTEQSLAEDERTGTPQTIYVYVPVNHNTIWRMMSDPKDDLTSSAESAIAEGYDQICAGVYVDLLTGIVVGAADQHITEATLRNVTGQFAEACKGLFEPGETEPFLIFHTRELNDVLADPLFTQYQYRGDGTPLVRGWTVRAHNTVFYSTNNIRFAGGIARNLGGLPRKTFGVAWNRKPQPDHQRFLGEDRIIVMADIAVMSKWPEYGYLYNTAEAVQ